jgi:hypothetical protein
MLYAGLRRKQTSRQSVRRGGFRKGLQDVADLSGGRRVPEFSRVVADVPQQGDVRDLLVRHRSGLGQPARTVRRRPAGGRSHEVAPRHVVGSRRLQVKEVDQISQVDSERLNQSVLQAAIEGSRKLGRRKRQHLDLIQEVNRREVGRFLIGSEWHGQKCGRRDRGPQPRSGVARRRRPLADRANLPIGTPARHHRHEVELIEMVPPWQRGIGTRIRWPNAQRTARAVLMVSAGEAALSRPAAGKEYRGRLCAVVAGNHEPPIDLGPAGCTGDRAPLPGPGRWSRVTADSDGGRRLPSVGRAGLAHRAKSTSPGGPGRRNRGSDLETGPTRLLDHGDAGEGRKVHPFLRRRSFKDALLCVGDASSKQVFFAVVLLLRWRHRADRNDRSEAPSGPNMLQT